MNDEMIVKKKEDIDIERTKLVQQIVLNKLGEDISNLDKIKELEGDEVAWEVVGVLIMKAVEAGLEFNANKIKKLKTKITLLGG